MYILCGCFSIMLCIYYVAVLLLCYIYIMWLFSIMLCIYYVAVLVLCYIYIMWLF